MDDTTPTSSMSPVNMREEVTQGREAGRCGGVSTGDDSERRSGGEGVREWGEVSVGELSCDCVSSAPGAVREVVALSGVVCVC